MPRKLVFIVLVAILYSGLLVLEDSLEKSSAINLKKLQVEDERLDCENEKLQFENKKYSTLDMLKKVAKEKKLVPPEQNQVIFLE
ncbi:MAG: cell division protein FtsL [Endomicrobiales bacterium]|nr:cell division protein FtsL [Endomicrobiales bacterium]